MSARAGHNKRSSRTEPSQPHKPPRTCIAKPNPPEEFDIDRELDIYLTGLCRDTVELVSGAAMVGVTLIDPRGTLATVARTGSIVGAIDAAQYQAGQGPCLEAAATLTAVTADRDAAAQRWPTFANVARTYGVFSFLSVPLPRLRPGMRTGTVNVYGTRDEGFQNGDTALMNLVASAVEHAIADAERYRDARNLALQLGKALDSRGVIDQAKGIVIAIHGVDADTAFRMLTNTSQRTNTKLRVVAEELIAGMSR